MGRYYIPVDDHLMDVYVKYAPAFVPKRRVAIANIQVSKKRLPYANPVDMAEVTRIIFDFFQEAWEPIHISPDSFLLDGQHRLKAAEKMGLRYIDVIVVDDELLDSVTISNSNGNIDWESADVN